MADGTYLIWSHTHGAWRAPGLNRFTTRLSEAGRCSRAEALMLCTMSIHPRVKALPALPVRLEDVLLMLRDPSGAEYVPGGEPWE